MVDNRMLQDLSSSTNRQSTTLDLGSIQSNDIHEPNSYVNMTSFRSEVHNNTTNLLSSIQGALEETKDQVAQNSMSQVDNSSMTERTMELTERSMNISKAKDQRFAELNPREYQRAIYNRIRHSWANDPMGYGSIVYLETGTGKTYIAIMLLKYLFSDHFIDYLTRLDSLHVDDANDPDGPAQHEAAALPLFTVEIESDEQLLLSPFTKEMIKQKQKERQEWVEEQETSGVDIEDILKQQKKVVFITPTQNLVEQQADAIEAYTCLNVGRYHGGHKQYNKQYSDARAWRRHLAQQDVLIVIANKFYDLLAHGFIKLEEIDMLVFDECHHANQDHPYSLIMRDFWFHDFDPEKPLKIRRPKVIGLTASPIKTKIERNKVQASEIECMLQDLSNNLYARFVALAPDDIQSLEEDLGIEIKSYRTDFERSLEAVTKIEQSLLNKMSALVKFPAACYRMTDYSSAKSMTTTADSHMFDQQSIQSSMLSQLVNTQVRAKFEEEQDSLVLKFLNGHKKMIELDVDFTRQNLSIAAFESYEDKVLLIFCIIIVKNINNLLLELGPLAVKAFFLDVKRDFLENWSKGGKASRRSGVKCEQAIRIIEEFCDPTNADSPFSSMQSSSSVDNSSINLEMNSEVDRDAFMVSDKITVLIDMLNESHAAKNDVKTIIFVKDRSVAVYLKKLLQGDENGGKGEANNDTSRNGFLHGLLDKDKFKIGFAMGFKAKNIVNRAYKSLNTDEISLEEDVLGSLPSIGTIKLSQNQLKETLEKFRKGTINVLIATNVVEEGLDVSTCNQVICLNEIQTVRTLIQMKGRAREKNSKFVFVCAQEQKDEFNESQAMFSRVIKFMKKITTKAQREVAPERDVLTFRCKNSEEYHPVPKTGAKATARHARILIEKFCTDFIEKISVRTVKTSKNQSSLSDTSQRAQNMSMTSSQQLINQTLNSEQIQAQIDERAPSSELNQSMVQSASSNNQDLSSNSSAQPVASTTSVDKHLELKPNYVTHMGMKEGSKFFYCTLYFPRRCKDLLRKQNPDTAFIKKRDAENHVALLALKRLHKKQILNDHLTLNLNHEKVMELIPARHEPPASQSSKQGLSRGLPSERQPKQPHSQSSRKNQSEYIATQNPIKRQKQVSEEMKQSERAKHKRFEQHKKQVTYKPPLNRINEQRYTNMRLTSLFVYVFRGVNDNHEYPYKDSNDFLGILFDRKFTNPSLEFLMYQEQRAKQKNIEHLNNLVRKGLMDMERQKSIEQREEVLEVALKQDDCFRVEFLGPPPRDMTTQAIQQLMAAKLQCYHTWLFYYLYSADYKFIKAIFKLKFSFAKILFARDFSVLFQFDKDTKPGIRCRKVDARDMLQKLYFSPDLKPKNNFNNSRAGGYNNQRDRHNYPRQQPAPRKFEFEDFIHYLQSDPEKLAKEEKVPLLAYTVPVTNRRVKKIPGSTTGGTSGNRVDWKTIDRVIDWIRSRIYELCLPTERTHALFKYSIDDPVRSFRPATKPGIPIMQSQDGQEKPFSSQEVAKDLALRERSHLTGRLWDQRFQGNRFVILDQELIHDSQDKPIDLNQSKKEFSVEKQEYSLNLTTFIDEENRKKRIRKMKLLSASQLSVQSKSFAPSNSSMSFMGPTASNLSMTVMDKTTQDHHNSHARSYKTREFYFLKQGIFEHRVFSKYIVKCRKERHFLDFGKKKRDEVLLEEQSLALNASGQFNVSAMGQHRFMVHGLKEKAYNSYSKRNHQHQLLQQQEQAKKRTNTEFDILDQMLTMAPISYNQYQVLQTTCYHMLNFNELLMIEMFINEVFGDLRCLLQREPDKKGIQPPAVESKDILRTYAQLEVLTKDQEEVQTRLVREQLLLRIDVVKEALTAPGACREFDYERLEFYGDSIIGFLVILELFVTQPSMVEGDLDFKRIQKVSNMRFFEVNEQFGFYNYMITESHQVYSGYDHAGFDPQSKCTCHFIKFCSCKRSCSKITQKHQNELQNKLAQLRLIQTRLERIDDYDSDALKQLFMRGNLYQLAEMIMKDGTIPNEPENLEDLYDDEYDDNLNQSLLTSAVRVKKRKRQRTEAEKIQDLIRRITTQNAFSPKNCLIMNIEKVIKKVESQISLSKKSGNDKRQKGPFYYKALADQVESVTGAVTLTCGLNCTQDYLRRINVLEHDQAHLMDKMTELVAKQNEKSAQLNEEFYERRQMVDVEKILDYTFTCKAWLIEALTHKSFQREHEKTNRYLDDYERLEFLGDAVLGCLMARHFFLVTQEDGIRKNPKELHKMKTSVINNNLLSLIVIENSIHQHMIYNQKAPSFFEQFEKYVTTVKAMSAEFGSTKQLVEQKKRNECRDKDTPAEDIFKEFDLDTLHEHNLKIFGDVFESLIGAVFLDSQCVEATWKVLHHLIKPYIYIYADLSTLQDHSRTLLLEMWNQKPYLKNLTCTHETQELEGGEKSRLNGVIQRGKDQRWIVYSETFTKDAKSKVRTFYKHFYQLVKKFVDEVDSLPEKEQRDFIMQPGRVIDELKHLQQKEIEERAEKEATQQKLLQQQAADSSHRTVIDIVEELNEQEGNQEEEKKQEEPDFGDSQVLKQESYDHDQVKSNDTPGELLGKAAATDSNNDSFYCP